MTQDATQDHRRTVPRTDALLADERLVSAVRDRGRDVVKAAVRRAQQQVRDGALDPGRVVEAVLAALPPAGTTLRPVLNATGAVLHTNLGRAQLSAAAVEAVVAAAGATDVEMDLTTGRRARRGRGTLDALRGAVPAAGDVHVVNNGAAALVLAATALAADREIVVSRGELVEIGDGFRLTDLLESTGARLREVGTTNRTSVADYRDAVGERTGFVLKVHPSNFVVSGFTAAVGPEQLRGLGVPVVVDIGSGLLAPDPLLPAEPDAASALAAGADLVTASGDKLLGGPQAGLLLGEAGLVERLRRHPLARALRVDKLTLAALEATLRAAPNPTRDAVHADPGELRDRSERVVRALAGAGVAAGVEPSVAVVGGGGAPGVELPSWVVVLPAELAVPLRTGARPVAGRVEGGRLLLDLRTVPAGADDLLVEAVTTTAATTAATTAEVLR
ncbi:L-seryl-tRNA(Sec) selenium transferase [Kineococcus aurantiacus]|uniref:L-seryl-tRNA(Sec) selenium transferase n=1 Tax=Kineococcus aurantiacus TaxID=37633 RepID=A0A7Y9DPT1_9ACTN|nr:L-seryl-tRNA(Ser) seleniumtransferase [Kineococcus aurantiacus]